MGRALAVQESTQQTDDVIDDTGGGRDNRAGSFSLNKLFVWSFHFALGFSDGDVMLCTQGATPPPPNLPEDTDFAMVSKM